MNNKKTAGVFVRYASAYDDLNAEKDYEAECTFLENIFREFGREKIREILDLGCGTGNHAIPMAERGYLVHGVDGSEEMLSIAREKASERGVQNRTSFQKGNIQDVSVGKAFDAIICMFAVLSYQTTDHEVVSTFNTVKNHLKEGGIFIADFWYGPAVLKQRPEVRVKAVQNKEARIVRNAEPEMNGAENIVHVNYAIKSVRNKQVLDEYREKHSMRFFFEPEIRSFLEKAGLSLETFCAFGNLEKEVDEDSWNAMMISRKL